MILGVTYYLIGFVVIVGCCLFFFSCGCVFIVLRDFVLFICLDFFMVVF